MASLKASKFLNSLKLVTFQRHTCLRSFHYTGRRLVINENDRPLPFSQSKAKTWDTVHSFRAPERNAPWYEKWSVLISTTAFLLYFLYLREENDMDNEIGKSLYDRVPGLEEKQIHQSIEYNTEHGMDTTALKKRLQELEAEKQ